MAADTSILATDTAELEGETAEVYTPITNTARSPADEPCGRAEQANPGDLDGDGNVGFRDILRLSSNFDNTHASRADGDLDADGVVGFADFVILADNFGVTPIDTAHKVAGNDLDVVRVRERMSHNVDAAFMSDGAQVANSSGGDLRQMQDDPTDVDQDGIVSKHDAQVVIDELNQRAANGIREADGEFELDVSRDGTLTPRDALLVINHLHQADKASAEHMHLATSQSSGSKLPTKEEAIVVARAIDATFGSTTFGSDLGSSLV